MIRAFFFAIVIFWAGSTRAQAPANASASPANDAAVETLADQPDRDAPRDGRKVGKPAPVDQRTASDATRRDRTSADGKRDSPAGRKPSAKEPERSVVEDASRNEDPSKREAAGSDDVAAELPDDLDSQSFGTGAEGGDAAAHEASALGAGGADDGQQKFPPLNALLAGIGAVFVVLLTTAAVMERHDIVKLRRMISVQGERIGTVNGRIDQQASLLIAPIQEQLKQLKERIEASERKAASMPTAPLVGRTSLEPEDAFVRRSPLVAGPPPRFPALVSDVIAQSAAAMVRVKADPIDQDVFVASHDGAFFLVQDGAAGLCIIPAHEPMTTQLYKTYYKSSYDCSVQGTGDLYVVEPATVSPRGGLWRLATRGKLEVRAS